LAANLAVAHTGRVLADLGARRDLAQSLAESVAELLFDLQRRLPGAALVLQIDEPSLPSVAAGAVPTPGGFFRHRAVDLPEISTALGWVSAAARPVTEEVILHSCAPWVGPGKVWPLASLLGERGAGLSGVSLDVDTLSGDGLDALAGAADAGAQLYLGVLPTKVAPLSADQLTDRVLRLVERLGNPPATALTLTPACGLASWSPAQVLTGLAALRSVAGRLAEELGQR
jgi:methionine synthase II (cobalamin-independent)